MRAPSSNIIVESVSRRVECRVLMRGEKPYFIQSSKPLHKTPSNRNIICSQNTQSSRTPLDDLSTTKKNKKNQGTDQFGLIP